MSKKINPENTKKVKKMNRGHSVYDMTPVWKSFLDEVLYSLRNIRNKRAMINYIDITFEEFETIQIDQGFAKQKCQIEIDSSIYNDVDNPAALMDIRYANMLFAINSLTLSHKMRMESASFSSVFAMKLWYFYPDDEGDESLFDAMDTNTNLFHASWSVLLDIALNWIRSLIMIRKIQRTWRSFSSRSRAAKSIQKHWRFVISNPKFNVCRVRLAYEFANM